MSWMFTGSCLWKPAPLLLVGLLFVIVAVSGCSGDLATEASVMGKVTLGDQPVSQGSILLVEQGGKLATMELTPDGGYQLRCAAGTYQVAILPPPPPDPLAKKTSETLVQSVPIPKKYRDVATSGLTIDVKRGENTFDMQLEPGAK